VPLADRYVNLHLLPMYQRRIAYGSKGFPWTSDVYKGHVSYDKGICPVAEDLQDRRFFAIGMCLYAFAGDETDLVVRAFQKVWAHLGELRT
jgi:hypothetical protein